MVFITFFVTLKCSVFCKMVILVVFMWFSVVKNLEKPDPVCAKRPHIPLLCLIINIFLGSVVNDTFSNLKLNFFIITGFIFSNKYVKQLVFINHSWISPTLQRGWGLEFCLFSKK